MGTRATSIDNYRKPRTVGKVRTKKLLADIFLWKDSKMSASILGCHFNKGALNWGVSLAYTDMPYLSISSSNPFPVVECRKLRQQVSPLLRIVINIALVILRSIASRKDLKKLIVVVAGLWVLSILGSYWNFLTLFYTTKDFTTATRCYTSFESGTMVSPTMYVRRRLSCLMTNKA